MSTYFDHGCSVEKDDTVPLLIDTTTNPLEKEHLLIRNDLSQIKTLHTTFKKKNRRNKSRYHDRMKQILEYDTTKLVYILSTVLFVVTIAFLIGFIYFYESFFMYSVFISTLTVFIIILACINVIATDSKRKRIKMFGKL